MKRLFSVVLLCALSITLYAQREFSYVEGDTTFTMKRYVFMLLNSGETKSKDSIEAAQFQKKHLNHLNELAELGKLVVAGPFENGGHIGDY